MLPLPGQDRRVLSCGRGCATTLIRQRDMDGTGDTLPTRSNRLRAPCA
jgi:hypothetical protein